MSTPIGELTLLQERSPAGSPKIVVILMVILIGPAVVLTCLAAPLLGLLVNSWIALAGMVVGALLLAALGVLIALLAMRLAASRAVEVELTSHRARVRRGGGEAELAWEDVARVAALRAPGTEGDAGLLDLALLAASVALDAHAERQDPRSSAYWAGASGLRLRDRDGRTLDVPLIAAPRIGPGLVRALAEGRVPLPGL